MTTPHSRSPNSFESPEPTVAATLADGTPIEMIYDADARVSSLVLGGAGDPRTVSKFQMEDGRTLVPYSGRNNLLTHRVVLFPSAPAEFGSRADLTAAIRRFIHAYCDVSELFEEIAVHYVLLSWLSDTFNELPYLRVQGPPGSGKTRFLLTVGALCYRPIFASGASTVSPLFRILDSMQGTLLLDEADFRFSDERAEVVKILNHGTVRGFPVLRSEQSGLTKEFNPRAYHVFGPKIIATRNGFEDPALESRFITERLGMQRLRADVPISVGREHATEALHLRNQLLLYRLRAFHAPRASPALDRSLEPRLAQIFGPLIAQIDDPNLRDRVLSLAHQYQRQSTVDRAFALEGQILEVLRDTLPAGGAVPTVKELAAVFAERYGPDVHVPVTPTWFGIQLRRRLGIVTQRRSSGFVIAPSEAPKLALLYERYGLSSPETAVPAASRGAPSSGSRVGAA